MKYTNPFPILDYYSPEYFCNRNKELDILLRACKNNRNITLTSIRRLGKTGLIKHLFYNIRQDKTLKTKLLYVDILKTQNLLDFVKEFSNKILKIEAQNANWLKRVSKLISGIKAQIVIDENNGTPSLQLAYTTPQQNEQSVDVIFNYLAEQKDEYLIAIDEFQQITNYPEKNIEAILRTHIQHQHKDKYIFSGSGKHILISMFNDYGRPFYLSTEMLTLERLDIDEYAEFIKEKFEKGKKKIELNLIKGTIKYLDVHTFYVQYFFNKLYETKTQNINKTITENVMTNILKEKEYVYLSYRNILTHLQFKLLKSIAKETFVSKPNSKEFIKKYDLSQPSSVNRTLKTLLDKEMIYYENGAYKVYDLFLAKWLEQM